MSVEALKETAAAREREQASRAQDRATPGAATPTSNALPLTLGKLRLLRLVAPFVAVIVAQALLAGVSMETLSAVRAYVGGEGLWSKGQKDAIHFLTLYSERGDEFYFRQFQSAIAIPLADRAARYALEADPPDLTAARDGFLGGGNHPDDIPAMIWLFRYFGNVSYMATAIRCWKATDPDLAQLESLGKALHEEYLNASSAAGAIDARKQQIEQIDRRLAPLALAFSQSLGAGSRSIKFLLAVANLLTAAGLIVLIVWHMRKLLRQRLAFENALRAEKERAQVTLASLGEAVISTDLDGRLDYMNPEAERLIGATSALARGSPLSVLFSIVDEAAKEPGDRPLDPTLSGETTRRCQLLVRRDSSTVPVSIVGAPLHSNGKPVGSVLVLHDRTSERELIARLSWQASHDALTGLANRREFEARLDGALGERTEATDEQALMFLDLDQFKVVNDTCGHAAGDELLRQTSDLLQDNLRPGDLLARLGGDEFGVLLKPCDDVSSLEIAERLRLAVQRLRFVWNGRAFNISMSIGLVDITQANTAEEIMQAADVACYMAKERGRNRVQAHLPSDSELARRVGEMAWVQRIRNALEEQRFCLCVQEIRALRDGAQDGVHVELLLRLRDETGEIVQPGSFIPAAERYDLMPLIDRWVVREAFGLMAGALASPGSVRISSCAINLSGATFGDDDFVGYVRQQLKLHRIPPEFVCFEVTETRAIANISSARRFIQALKKLGCRFSLDDFGAGMSSFSYLKNLPVDYIKIDGGFVKEMLNSRIDRAMVEMIAHMAKVMGKSVIAEFVENEAIVAALREIGVDYAQGYAIGRPMPFDEFCRGAVDLPPPRRRAG
ncbi:EAL domain-containing protein [Methylocapsa sp. S129]|uniref:EAL domain-containing protein n=1 Tax=Methylocapsa sp. S129 TaxID=1641869 RepID=UPI001FF06C98|nr:EAL domain-containing protein [Methylocapsa sp. S129]